MNDPNDWFDLLEPWEIFMVLFNNASPVRYHIGSMCTEDDAKGYMKRLESAKYSDMYIDYVDNRPMKIQLIRGKLDFTLYNRDNRDANKALEIYYNSKP